MSERDNDVTGTVRPAWPHASPLIHGDDDPLLPHLAACFPKARLVCIAVAFVLDQGVDLIRPFLVDLLANGGELRLLTGDYFDVSEPRGLERLLDLQTEESVLAEPARLQLRVFETRGKAFHPKAYVFHHDGDGIAFVGSSNLSRSALGNGVEWNYRIVASSDAVGFAAVTRGFDELFVHERTVPLTAEWIAAYRARRVVAGRGTEVEVASEELAPAVAHAVQREALAALRRSRELGHRAGLVVLATGLGKTWLSAFDSVAFASERGNAQPRVRVAKGPEAASPVDARAAGDAGSGSMGPVSNDLDRVQPLRHGVGGRP